MMMTRQTLSLALLLMLLGSALETTLSVPPCPNMIDDVSPCISFIMGTDAAPSPSCCSGAQTVASTVTKRQDRIRVCDCLKSSLTKITPYDPEKLPQVSTDCHLTIQIPPIDNSTDCSKIP